MMDPWTELEITPTSDERAIKRAYVKKLKITNPEDNPEGFARLRDAYEQAVRRAGWMARDEEVETEGVFTPPTEEVAPRGDGFSGPLLSAAPASGGWTRVQVVADCFEREGEAAGLRATYALWRSDHFANLDTRREIEGALLEWLVQVRPFPRTIAAAATAKFDWSIDTLSPVADLHGHIARRTEAADAVQWLEINGKLGGPTDAKAASILLGRVDPEQFASLATNAELEQAIGSLIDRWRDQPFLSAAFSEGASEAAWRWWTEALGSRQRERDRRKRAFLAGAFLFAPLGLFVMFAIAKAYDMPAWTVFPTALSVGIAGALLHWLESTRLGPTTGIRYDHPKERWHKHFVITPWIVVTVGSVATAVLNDVPGIYAAVFLPVVGGLVLIHGRDELVFSLVFPLSLAYALSELIVTIGFPDHHWIAGAGCWYPPALGFWVWVRGRVIDPVTTWNGSLATVNWLANAATASITILVAVVLDFVRDRTILRDLVYTQLMVLFAVGLVGRVWKRW